MILDHLANARRYAGLHPLFGAAFAWAGDPANADPAPGRYPLIGDDLTVVVDHGRTEDPALRRFESHRWHIDIQINRAGGEVMEWHPANALAVALDFEEGGDIRFHHPPTLAGTPTRALVPPGHFTIFWPEDAHKPICHPAGTAVDFRKLVFKVAVNPKTRA
jgi:YhcH/YjgK/YiaL family protein